MQPSEPTPLWRGREVDGPVVAVAVHAGHRMRDEVAVLSALDGPARLREEDPGTDAWVSLAGTQLVAERSRFEVDLNRPRDAAVYQRPEDAWGLRVWQRPLPADIIERSLAAYDAWYSVLAGMLDRIEAAWGRFVVYDLHSYNYRRGGPDSPESDPVADPDINIGTGSMDRARWAPLVDRLLEDLASTKVPYGEGRLDVQENARFRGGYLARWIHERYPATGCALAVEVKKFYMDERTGVIDEELLGAVGEVLAATVPGVVSELVGPAP